MVKIGKMKLAIFNDFNEKGCRSDILTTTSQSPGIFGYFSD